MPSEHAWISTMDGDPSGSAHLNMQVVRISADGFTTCGGWVDPKDRTRGAMICRLDPHGNTIWMRGFNDGVDGFCNDINLGQRVFVAARQAGQRTGISWHDASSGDVTDAISLSDGDGMAIKVSSLGTNIYFPIFSGQIGNLNFYDNGNRGLIGKPGSWSAYVGGGPGHASLFGNAEDGTGAVFTVGCWHDPRITGRIGTAQKLKMQQNMIMRWKNVHDRGVLDWAIAVEPAIGNDARWNIAWFNVVCDAQGNAVVIGEDNDEMVTVAKVTKQGRVLWFTRLGNGSNNGGYPGLHIDREGNVLACGQPGYEKLVGGYIFCYKLSGETGELLWQRLLTHDMPVALWFEFGVRCLDANAGSYGIAGRMGPPDGSLAFLANLPADGSIPLATGGWRYTEGDWMVERPGATVMEISPPITEGGVITSSDTPEMTEISGVGCRLDRFDHAG